jgi:tetratricopeptide (TPR) repeat protein
VRRRLAALALCASGAAAAVARAEPSDEASQAAARTLGYAGVAAYDAGDYAAASEQLENAYRLFPVPSLGLWSARALAKRGLLLEAEARLAAVARLPIDVGDAPVQERAQADAVRERAELVAQIPRVLIELSGAAAAELVLTLDGAALAAERLAQPLLLNPGRHTLVATRGVERSEVALRLLAGDRETARLVFQAASGNTISSSEPVPASVVAPLPAPVNTSGESTGSSAWQTAGWVAVGVGGASLVTGAIAYFAGKNRQHTMQERGECDGARCLESDDLGAYETLHALNRAGFIAGGVLTITGVSLLVLDPGDARSTPSVQSAAPRFRDGPVTLRIGAGSVQLNGWF